MRTSKMVNYSLTPETLERFNEYAKKESINKSALIERLLIEEMDKKEKIKIKQNENK